MRLRLKDGKRQNKIITWLLLWIHVHNFPMYAFEHMYACVLTDT